MKPMSVKCITRTEDEPGKKLHITKSCRIENKNHYIKNKMVYVQQIQCNIIDKKSNLLTCKS